MAASNPSGGGGGYYSPGGWHIPPQTPPTRMHPLPPATVPIPPIYHTPQQVQYHNQWPGAVPQTASAAMRYQHQAPRGVPQSPISYQQQPPAGPDMPSVLISLADTYINTAYANGHKTALGSDAEVKAYYKLVATGLQCLEMALQHRLQPRVEAMVRLRHASILYEETNNLDEAEESLNKAILLAHRNNLTELKCSLQYLMVKIMFKSNHKAALKILSSHISDVETLDIPLWAYAFRLLRFNLLAQMSPARDDQNAISTLRTVCTMSNERRDMQVLALASIMEAMVSLRNGADGVEAAQRSLARVFTQQNGGNQITPQLEVLTQVLDICCSVMLGKTQECDPKIRKLHNMLDQPERWINWREDAEFEVLVNPSRHGRPTESLKLRWLSRDEVFTLGYFLSGLCKFQKNVEENGKAERFLTEGLKTVERKKEGSVQSSLEESKNKLYWRWTLKAYMYLYYAFLLSMRTDWDSALKVFKQLQEVGSLLNLAPDSPLSLQIAYLDAVIKHGTNDLYNALCLYNFIIASLPGDHELSIISKLNSILIQRIHNPPAAENLLASIERLGVTHKNELLRAAFIAVKATERGSLITTKNYLSTALRQAAAAGNVQLTFIVLNFMCHRFFNGVISEQAEKSAKAAMQNAKKGRDTLWTLMGGQMYADCLARKGNEIEEVRQRQMNEDARVQVVRNLVRNFPPSQQLPVEES
ncbi:cohesin loading factor [Sphaerosporella brunnea]|uniref:Cohesin loading factor n=1 Tax=Sphaerosporella brunnea TaxID=1250544 RepID=A0A5J5F8K2_9PEZI|nr:cohesin loading factor [Sphaerosporella brunnea]